MTKRGQIIVTFAITVGDDNTNDGERAAVDFLYKITDMIGAQPECRYVARQHHTIAERKPWGNPLSHVRTIVSDVSEQVGHWNARQRFNVGGILDSIQDENDRARTRAMFRVNREGRTALPYIPLEGNLANSLKACMMTAALGVENTGLNMWYAQIANDMDGKWEDGVIDTSQYDGDYGNDPYNPPPAY